MIHSYQWKELLMKNEYNKDVVKNMSMVLADVFSVT
jgi:hypothetical protein